MTDLTRTSDSWLTSAPHQQWLHNQGQALLDFAKAARVPLGFAGLDRFGKRPDDAPARALRPWSINGVQPGRPWIWARAKL